MIQLKTVKRSVMNVRNKSIFLIFFFIVAISYLSITTHIDYLPSQKQETRDELNEIFNSTNLGGEYSYVKNKFYELNKRMPKLSIHESDEELQLLAPIELPRLTTSWILIIRIKNGLVVGKGIRIYEGWYRPCDAGIDEGEIKPPSNTPNNKSCV